MCHVESSEGYCLPGPGASSVWSKGVTATTKMQGLTKGIQWPHTGPLALEPGTGCQRRPRKYLAGFLVAELVFGSTPALNSNYKILHSHHMQDQIPKFHSGIWGWGESKKGQEQPPWEGAEKRKRRLRNLMRKNEMETCENIVSQSVFQRALVLKDVLKHPSRKPQPLWTRIL